MKAFRNPWVTGVLGTVAVAVVLVQLQPVLLKGAPARKASAPVPAVAATPARTAGHTATRLEAEAPVRGGKQRPSNAPIFPTQAVDSAYALAHLAEWTNAPRRDPFLLVSAASRMPKSTNEPPSPVTKWTLNAIWRQTDGRVAVINNRAYAEGDRIEAYQVESIDDDQVWFRGPQRMERLGLKKADKGAPSTSSAAGSANQQAARTHR